MSNNRKFSLLLHMDSNSVSPAGATHNEHVDLDYERAEWGAWAVDPETGAIFWVRFSDKGRQWLETCGVTWCDVDQLTVSPRHDDHCKLASGARIECEHGFDVCPKCDLCTCVKT